MSCYPITAFIEQMKIVRKMEKELYEINKQFEATANKINSIFVK